jgi:hypothetical protein
MDALAVQNAAEMPDSMEEPALSNKARCGRSGGGSGPEKYCSRVFAFGSGGRSVRGVQRWTSSSRMRNGGDADPRPSAGAGCWRNHPGGELSKTLIAPR